MNLSFLFLIIATVLAVLAVLPLSNPSQPRPWVSYFWPLSWACFLLSLVFAHGGINWHG
jgi:hypothetical protein